MNAGHIWLRRDFRAAGMAGLRRWVAASIWLLMKFKPRWEPGPGIRVVHAEFRSERWIVEAEGPGVSADLKPLDQNRLVSAQNTFIDSVRSTFSRLEENDLERVVSLLADLARPIFIVGGKFSGVLASHLGNYLTILRPSVRVIRAEATDGSFAMLDVTQRAVFVVFDYRRYQCSLLQWISSAKENGAIVALLTDQHLSPVASLADHVLVCNANILGRFDSLVTGHVLVDLLIHLVFDMVGSPAHRRLEAFESFRRFDE